MNRNDLPKPNATCEVCGRMYRSCKTCAQLRSSGIEAWREHCDSIECYQTLVFCSTEDLSKVSKDEYEYVMSLELPEGRKPVENIQKKLDKIKDYLYPVEIKTVKSTMNATEKKDNFKNDKWSYSKPKYGTRSDKDNAKTVK